MVCSVVLAQGPRLFLPIPIEEFLVSWTIEHQLFIEIQFQDEEKLLEHVVKEHDELVPDYEPLLMMRDLHKFLKITK